MLQPRIYQLSILETAKQKNTLVVLPTGLGKTLIALLLAKERLKLFPSSKILFLAPTRPLVEQHYHYFKKNIETENLEIHLFTGKINQKKRVEIWKKAQIIFSTPQCIQNDLKKGLIDLKDVSLLIEDEAHKCLRNYSYTFVAQKYKEQAKNPRILGLTASPSHEASKIKEICKNLGIEAIEVRTRESPDVKPYLQKLSYEIIKVELPKELQKIRELLKKIYDKKIEELKNRRLLFEKATKKTLLELQAKLKSTVLSGQKNFNILKGVSVCAQAIKLQHALELLETQTMSAFFNYIQDLYEQAKQKKSKAVIQLVKTKEFQEVYFYTYELHKKGFEHPKISSLKEILLKEKEKNPEIRVLVFSQYRDSVSKINDELTKLNIKSKIFIGQANKKLDGLTQKEQQLILHEFREGKINVLVSTSIGEEGLDIPEVDLVIFYEPIPSAIRKIQRAGRTARLKPGKLIILITKKTRDESYHWAAYNK
ncbi:MAG: helicase-related protein [Candidatus Pacearchaeota archaeon]|nr:helicase-related protein [Candidatus Pacearchaeota archaeon]